MKYIKKIIIKNFQSHKYSEIELSGGLNVLIGESNSGKTAIIRALKWLFLNEPRGLDFLRVGEKDIFVKIIYNNNIEITRGNTSNKNYYELNINNDIQRFEGFGSTVPYEIQQITGVRKIEIDQNNYVSINISSQLDSPFFLSLSEPSKANFLGKLIDAHYVDFALKKAISDKKSNLQNIRYLSEQNEVHRNELNQFEGLGDLIDKISKAKKIERELVLNNELLNIFNSQKSSLKAVKSDIDDNVKILSDLSSLGNINQNYYMMREKSKFLNSLIIINKKMKELDISIKKISTNLNKIENLNTAIQTNSDLQNINNMYKFISLSARKYSDITKNKIYQYRIIEKVQSVDSLESLYNSAMRNLKSYDYLRGFHIKLKDIKSRIIYGTDYLKAFHGIGYADKVSEEMKQKYSDLLKLSEIGDKLKTFKTDKTKLLNDIERLKSEIDSNSSQYVEILKSLRICPTCGRTFEDVDMENLKSHIGE